MKKQLLAAFAVLLGTSAVLSSAFHRGCCNRCDDCYSSGYSRGYGYNRGGWGWGWGGYW